MYDFSAPPAAICSLIIEDCRKLRVLPKGMVEMCLDQTRKRKDFEACAARSRLQLALHAQRTAGFLHVARSAPGRDTRADAQRGILLRPCRASSASISRKRCVPRTYRCRRCANTVYVTDKMKTFKELTLCCLAELRE